jgi:hypothetical protein
MDGEYVQKIVISSQREFGTIRGVGHVITVICRVEIGV